MADTLALGKKALALEVSLYREADFVDSLQREDGTPWPVGSTLTLQITLGDNSTVSWPATYAGDTARWNVDKVEVMAAINARPKAVRLWYVEDDADLLWGQGKVKVDPK